ncbi:MAG: DUF4440 domain-containing protein [Candidatus Eisenbacteria bacterium]
MSDDGDLEAIDELVARFYSAFENTVEAPKHSDVAACFVEGARIVRCASGGPEFYSVAEFAAPRIALLSGGGLTGFSERETSAATERIGGVASRTSRYAKSGMLHGEAYAGSGTKWFHLVRLSEGWRISALSWIDDGA